MEYVVTGAPLTFEDFARVSWPSLYRYAYLLAGNHADAEDIAQQTLLKAHGSWARVRDAQSPPAYLRTMLTNTFLSQRRPQGRRLEVLTEAPPEFVGAPKSNGLEDRMTLWPHVKSQPPRQRAVIVLRYYEDLSEDEIADVLRCSRGNVKSTAHHALKALRVALDASRSEGRTEMYADFEASLTQELSQVADSVAIPPLPALPSEPTRVRRNWTPLLVAASVALVSVCTVLVMLTRRGETPSPAPSPPTPSETRLTEAPTAKATIPKSAPTIAYVVNQKLFVAGDQVEGEWWSVDAGPAGWLGLGTDNVWRSGTSADATDVGELNIPPVLSPDGRYVATIEGDGTDGTITLTETGTGRRLGQAAIDTGDPDDGSLISILVVTNYGRVIAQGTKLAVLWSPIGDGETIDLLAAAPEQLIVGNTQAGLVVTQDDGFGTTEPVMGEPYLATISESGVLTKIADLPQHDALAASPGGTLAWVEPGTLGGEVAAIPTLQLRKADGSEPATLSAPEGWAFKTTGWAWEDEDYLIAPVLRDNGQGKERLARCRLLQPVCVLIEGP